MPVPRRIDQCDRLVSASLNSRVGSFWNCNPKRLEGDKIIFRLKSVTLVHVLRKYKPRYEREIERGCGVRLEIDWEF